jgi:pyruvate dehydrogenase E2 component (dihydrolipoamide acetyltransferase)
VSDAIQDVVMPKFGVEMEPAVLTKWLKRIGDEIQRGELLFEAETGKAVQEVAADISGVLIEQTVSEGDEVPLLTVVGRIRVRA